MNDLHHQSLTVSRGRSCSRFRSALGLVRWFGVRGALTGRLLGSEGIDWLVTLTIVLAVIVSAIAIWPRTILVCIVLALATVALCRWLSYRDCLLQLLHRHSNELIGRPRVEWRSGVWL